MRLTRSEEETREFCEKFKREGSSDIRRKLQSVYHELTYAEVVSLCDLRPGTIEQAKLLIPTLDENYADTDIKNMISMVCETGRMEGESDDYDL